MIFDEMKKKLNKSIELLEELMGITLLEYHNKNHLSGSDASRSQECQQLIVRARNNMIELKSYADQGILKHAAACKPERKDEFAAKVSVLYGRLNNLSQLDEIRCRCGGEFILGYIIKTSGKLPEALFNGEYESERHVTCNRCYRSLNASELEELGVTL